MSSTELATESLSILKDLDLISLKSQEITLSCLQLKLAQREAARIEKLSVIIELLEDEIFNPDIVTFLTPAEQIQRYQLALQATQASSTYIAQTTKSINWQDIENKIMILQSEGTSALASSSADSNDLQNAALKMLHKLSTMDK